MDYHGVNGFLFPDELFNISEKWVLDFCDALEKSNLRFIWRANVRANEISKKAFERMKEVGCIHVNIGHESGSDRILKEMGKGVKLKHNIARTLEAREADLIHPIQLVIGSPGETTETINETIDFLIKTETKSYSLNYMIALPETPVWKHVEDNNLIPDVEKYLEDVSKIGGGPLVNLTRASDIVWLIWPAMIRFKVDRYFALKEKNWGKTLKAYFYYIKSCLRAVLKITLKPYL